MTKTTIKLLLLTTMTLILSACATTKASAQAGPCGNLNTPSAVLPLDLEKFELKFRNKKQMCLDFRTASSGTFRIRVEAGTSGYTWTAGAITVESKNQSTGAPVIIGSNSAANPNEIIVDVTDASVPVTNSADYAYWIKVPGVEHAGPDSPDHPDQLRAAVLGSGRRDGAAGPGVDARGHGLNREELERRLRTKFESQPPAEAY